MKKAKTKTKTSKQILVVGSSNTDMVIKSNDLPRPGETVLGGVFFMNPGGKGANQAVACARLGGNVTFICKTGNDIFGHQSQQQFEEEEINTSYVFSDLKKPSGVALIFVDETGENAISVASGSNSSLQPSDISLAEEAFDKADLILIQLEIPMDTVEFTAKLAKEKGKLVILNPAPAPSIPLSSNLLKNIHLINPNEIEAEIISGIKVIDIETAVLAAKKIFELGVSNVIITLGSKGALLFDGVNSEFISGFKVKASDSTGAGDCFSGALAIAISEGLALPDAVRFANKAAAISVTRQGAQTSLPYRAEVDVWKFN
jgi:ribokinase